MRKSQKAWPCARIGVSGDAKASLSAASRSERARSGLGAVSDHVRRRDHWHGNAEVSQGLNCAAGAAFWQGRAQISWQAQHFRKVKYRFRGRCSNFARSSAKFVAGASLSQGQVQISRQAQHFRKVKYRFRGRRSTFARSTFAAGARTSQPLSTKVEREVNFRSRGSKIATFKYESSTRSPLSQPGLENRNF